jgi:hypothetical protein
MSIVSKNIRDIDHKTRHRKFLKSIEVKDLQRILFESTDKQHTEAKT